MEGEVIDWKKKYKAVKERLKSLKNLRYTAVEADIENLKAKIEEHISVHRDTIIEIKNENRRLTKWKEELEKAKKESFRLEQKNNSIRERLKNNDSILLIFLDQKIFVIKFISPGKYEINFGDDISFILELKENFVIYSPKSIPKDFVFSVPTKVHVKDLKEFCERIVHYCQINYHENLQ